MLETKQKLCLKTVFTARVVNLFFFCVCVSEERWFPRLWRSKLKQQKVRWGSHLICLLKQKRCYISYQVQNIWTSLRKTLCVCAQGAVPFMVNATAGTTVLGAFDPIQEIADICEKYKLWLHVDVSSFIHSSTHILVSNILDLISVWMCLFSLLFFRHVGVEERSCLRNINIC